MLADKLCSLLTQAVRDCIRPHENVALFLSGGLDSAVIQAIAGLDLLYCVTWPDQDNLTVAKLAAPGKTVVPVTFSRDEMVEVLPEVARLTDGKGTWSQVCQWFAAKAARKDGADVVLTGESADELFGGYARYIVLAGLDWIYDHPKLEAYQGLIEYQVGTKEEVLNRMFSRTSTLKVRRPPEGSLVHAMAREEEAQGLPPLLECETAMIEAHGLSARYPFADQRVASFAHDLPPKALVTETETKHILREAARMLGVHDHIVNEKTKKGLFVPQSWRPAGEKEWSRRWFEKLMAEAWEAAA